MFQTSKERKRTFKIELLVDDSPPVCLCDKNLFLRKAYETLIYNDTFGFLQSFNVTILSLESECFQTTSLEVKIDIRKISGII